MNKWGIGFIGLIVVGLGLGIGYAKLSAPPEINMKSHRVTFHQMSAGIKVPGNVVPLRRVQLFPPVPGRIEAVYVQEGDYVREGQLLAEMSSVERATILDVAKSEGSDQVKYWEKVYKPIKIFSPISGQIIVVGSTIAQVVTNTTALFAISDQLMIRAQVDETDLAKIQPGMRAIITPYTYPDKKVEARVKGISYESAVVNNVSVYTVDIRLISPSRFMRSGMTVGAWVETSPARRVLAIPEGAIQYRNNRPVVMMKIAGRGVERPIQIGIQQHGLVEVVSGVSANEVVWIPRQPLPKDVLSSDFNPFQVKSN